VDRKRSLVGKAKATFNAAKAACPGVAAGVANNTKLCLRWHLVLLCRGSRLCGLFGRLFRLGFRYAGLQDHGHHGRRPELILGNALDVLPPQRVRFRYGVEVGIVLRRE